MDRISRQLVEYTQDFHLAAVPGVAKEAALRHLVDAIAVSIAGYSTESAQIGIRVAKSTSGSNNAIILGAGASAAPAYAAMANAIMIRSLDWNDGMLAKGGGHPSDMIPGVLAAAEVTGATGAQVLEGVLLAYELLGSVGSVAGTNRRGWDQGTFMGLATALAAGKIYGLTAEQLGHALSIAIVPAIPMLVTRRGALSMWKGAATSIAIRHAMDAVALAREGMTSPGEPFEGTMGVFDQLSGPFEITLPADPGGRYAAEISHMKQFPAETHCQTLITLTPELLAWRPLDQIESIDIECYWEMYNAIGSHESVYDPQNRETADHSLPYVMAVAMVDGTVDPSSFVPERIADPSLRPVMRKIRVRENPEYTAQYRPAEAGLAASPKVRVTTTAADGEQRVDSLTYAKGHSSNPMTREDIDAKLALICAGVLDDEHRDRISSAWWSIEDSPGVGEALSTVVRYN
jgi:2-methylcitrate dehydratase